MASTNKRWEENIAEAMNETQRADQPRSDANAIYLPNWFSYGICILFGFLLAKTLSLGIEAHSTNEERDYQTGSSVALLMVAEDVEHYRTTYGKLPDEFPSPIATVMNVSYEKITNDHFRLTMPHGDSNLIFDASADKIVME